MTALGMGAEAGHRSIVRNAGYLMAASVGARALRVVYLIVLARAFGPELFGLFTHAQFWHALFMSVAIFGTGRMLSRSIGGDRAHADAVVATNLTLRLLASLAAALGCALIALSPGLAPLSRELLLLFALAVLGRSLAEWTQQAFVAFETAELGLRQAWVFRGLETGVGLAAIALGADLIVVVSIHVATWFLQALVGGLLVTRRLVPMRLD